MPTNYLPQDDHVIRYVSWARLQKDEEDEDKVVGVLPVAFRLREGEQTLSVTWVEFHRQDSFELNLVASVRTIRASEMKPTKKSGFAFGKVADIDSACRARSRPVRFIHEPEDDNRAHAAIHRWPSEIDDLLARLATDEWSRLILNKDVP